MKQYAKRSFITWLTIFLLAFLIVPINSFAPSGVLVKGDVVSASRVRDRILEIAEAYENHAWTPSEQNAYHTGSDDELRLDGLRVETPDEGYIKPTGGALGWWAPNEINVGIPYKWGGFSDLSQFDEGIESGKYAGDIWTNYDEKATTGNEKQLGSSHAVGVDCSGFVSRCWGITHHNSWTLIEVSWPIRFDDLKEGDILCSPGNHVMIFKQFLAFDKTIIEVYEASAWDWKVSERIYDCEVNDQPYWAYDRKNKGYVQVSREGHGVALTHNGFTAQYWAYSHIRPILFDDTHDEDNDEIVAPDALLEIKD